MITRNEIKQCEQRLTLKDIQEANHGLFRLQKRVAMKKIELPNNSTILSVECGGITVTGNQFRSFLEPISQSKFRELKKDLKLDHETFKKIVAQ
jgi:hypothetical protein